MKYKNLINFFLVLSFISCNPKFKNVPIENVTKDKKSNLILYKNNKEKVTGNIISTEKDNGIQLKTVQKVIEGKIISCISYFPNGNKRCEYSRDEDGLIKDNIIWYFENGNIDEERPFLKGKANGVAIRYNEDGKKIMEQIYRNDEVVKEYSLDENGDRNIFASENLYLQKIVTGFLQENGMNGTLYKPIVLMKFMNKSDTEIQEKLVFEGVFIDEDKNEELSVDRDYFQNETQAPFLPKLYRQSKLKSSVGRTNSFAVPGTHISCRITLNGNLYRTIKIQDKILYTDRIQ